MSPFETDERPKCFLDGNQPDRERMCPAILKTDQSFSSIQPHHPRGGGDGGSDIELLYQNEIITYGAVGFQNQANDSNEQRRKAAKKI